MGRYKQEFPTGLSRRQAQATASTLLDAKCFRLAFLQGEEVWQYSPAIQAPLQCVKVEVRDGVVGVEAWEWVLFMEQDPSSWMASPAYRKDLLGVVEALGQELSGDAAAAEGGSAGGASPPPGWRADPRGLHELRYWDGSAWTEHVSDRGMQSTDPV